MNYHPPIYTFPTHPTTPTASGSQQCSWHAPGNLMLNESLVSRQLDYLTKQNDLLIEKVIALERIMEDHKKQQDEWLNAYKQEKRQWKEDKKEYWNLLNKFQQNLFSTKRVSKSKRSIYTQTDDVFTQMAETPSKSAVGNWEATPSSSSDPRGTESGQMEWHSIQKPYRFVHKNYNQPKV